jgi:hypothetical protein
MKYVVLAVVVFALARVHAGMNADGAMAQQLAPAQRVQRVELKQVEAPKQPLRTLPEGLRAIGVIITGSPPPEGTKVVDLIADVPGQANLVVIFPRARVLHGSCPHMADPAVAAGNVVTFGMSIAEIELLLDLRDRGATFRIDDYDPQPRRKRG